MRNKLIIFFCICWYPAVVFAQGDVFTGTWQMQYQPAQTNLVINLELSIASPENNQLYPAQLKLKSDEFTATYNLLLVKKNIRQLAIGRNKIPMTETPFVIGNWTVMMNGTFDLSKDNKGTQFLTAERMFAKKYELPMPELKGFDSKYLNVASHLNEFLKDAEIKLKKINNNPWQSEQAEVILHCGKIPGYYGIIDSVQTKERDATIEFPGSKKSANGIVSVMLNGSMIIDQADLSYKKPREEIRLDTGMNILVFFAEAYGRSPSTTGKLKLGFGQKDILMDFAGKDNVAATFIVAKIFNSGGIEDADTSRNHISKDLIENISENGTRNTDQSGIGKNDPQPKLVNGKQLPENTLLRDAKIVGSIIVTSKQIKLAIWDDAVEDGDSISLSLNGKWITQGLAVKKKPQFILVTVEPGPNKITFIADNLGSIIPNTSVLEIIDGKERKSFMIDTNLRQNNLINIYYDNKP